MYSYIYIFSIILRIHKYIYVVYICDERFRCCVHAAMISCDIIRWTGFSNVSLNRYQRIHIFVSLETTIENNSMGQLCSINTNIISLDRFYTVSCSFLFFRVRNLTDNRCQTVNWTTSYLGESTTSGINHWWIIAILKLAERTKIIIDIQWNIFGSSYLFSYSNTLQKKEQRNQFIQSMLLLQMIWFKCSIQKLEHPSGILKFI